MTYNDNDSRKSGRFLVWGLVVLVLVGGLVLWGYRKNDPANIEPAAGDTQIESEVPAEAPATSVQ